MRTVIRLLRQPGFHIFVFCLLFILFNWPFLAVPAHDGLLNLFVYLFALWAALVLLLFVIARGIRSGKDADKQGGG